MWSKKYVPSVPMLYVATRQDEELQTLKKFIENLGKKFSASLLDYSQKEPCDVEYDGVQYQITEGNQEYLARKRIAIKKLKRFCMWRSGVESNDPRTVIEEALKNKILKSDKGITLLVDCTSSGDFLQDRGDRERTFQRYMLNHKELRGSWKEIFAVFQNQNIKL